MIPSALICEYAKSFSHEILMIISTNTFESEQNNGIRIRGRATRIGATLMATINGCMYNVWHKYGMTFVSMLSTF